MAWLQRIPAWFWLLLPALAFVLAMAVFPLGYSFALSLRQWKLARMDEPGPWVGLENYQLLLTDDPEFFDAVKATAIFLGWDVAVTLLLALAAALLLRRQGRVYSLARVLLILPFVMSPAVIGISFKFFLNAEYGIAQYLLGWLIPALQSPYARLQQ